MNDIHSDYLKDEHFEDEEDEELNMNSQKTFPREIETEDDELENNILQEVLKTEQKQDTISEDLEKKLELLLERIGGQNEQEIVKLRMNELALSKILVYTHGKSEFRLVVAHHHLGRAYLNYKCYEQAIDHLTMALKKNSKLGDIKETKLYHSILLTSLSKCYYQINSFEDALQVLTRALEIQNASYKELDIEDKCNVETLKLTACCYLKRKNYQKAHEYIKVAWEYCERVFGARSKQVAKLKIEGSRICFQQKNYESAIEQLDQAIEILIQIGYKNKLQLIQLQELLSSYYQKNDQPDKQIQTMLAKLELVEQIYEKEHKNTLKLKRNIASTMIKHQKNKEAVSVLEEILQSEEKIYGPGSLHVGKTLKMLGMVFMSEQEYNSAEHYLKRAQKILHDQGNTKLVKEIRGKLVQIKQSREKRINSMIEQQS